ncbi:hypothetical protein NDI39_06025 [Microcoleus sp. ZQ-A2]
MQITNKGRRQKAEGRRQKAEGRRQKAEGRRQKAEGRRQKAEGTKNSMEWVLLPTPETKKFGKTDDYRLLNQNIVFQANVKKTWEHNSPLPFLYLLPSECQDLCDSIALWKYTP